MKDIKKDELIGLSITVVDSPNPALLGIKGQVIDETKNTLLVQGQKRCRLIKDQVVFETAYKGKLLRINGKTLTKRPEDRIKGR